MSTVEYLKSTYPNAKVRLYLNNQPAFAGIIPCEPLKALKYTAVTEEADDFVYTLVATGEGKFSGTDWRVTVAIDKNKPQPNPADINAEVRSIFVKWHATETHLGISGVLPPYYVNPQTLPGHRL